MRAYVELCGIMSPFNVIVYSLHTSISYGYRSNELKQDLV